MPSYTNQHMDTDGTDWTEEFTKVLEEIVEREEEKAFWLSLRNAINTGNVTIKCHQN